MRPRVCAEGGIRQTIRDEIAKRPKFKRINNNKQYHIEAVVVVAWGPIHTHAPHSCAPALLNTAAELYGQTPERSSHLQRTFPFPLGVADGAPVLDVRVVRRYRLDQASRLSIVLLSPG